MSANTDFPIGSKVYGALGSQYDQVAAEVRGNAGRCQLTGCRGAQLHLRWPDGTVTKPCINALDWDPNHKVWRIG